jgi:hypothetical protein
MQEDPITPDPNTRTFRLSRTRLQHGFLLSAVLAAIGLLMLVAGGPRFSEGPLIGALNLVFAAGVLLVVLRAARDPRPRMVIGREGVWYRDWGLPVVRWTQVEGAHLTESRLLGALCLEIRDPDVLFAGLDAAARAKVKSNRLVRPPRLLVPNGTLDAPLGDIVAAIEEGMARARRAQGH